jgi:hypothetical protein
MGVEEVEGLGPGNDPVSATSNTFPFAHYIAATVGPETVLRSHLIQQMVPVKAT